MTAMGKAGRKRGGPHGLTAKRREGREETRGIHMMRGIGQRQRVKLFSESRGGRKGNGNTAEDSPSLRG